MVEEKTIQLDLFQSLKQKVILIENLYPNGGTRQFLKLLKFENFRDNTVFYLIRRNFNSPKNIIGFIKDYIYAVFHKPRNTEIKLIFNPICIQSDTLYISTSRRTLNFITELDSPNHTHYFQHIEFWEYLNSNEFLEHCTVSGYPSSSFFSNLFSIQNELLDNDYKTSLPKINNFLTVSKFLYNILKNLNKSNINIMKVLPHINHPNKFSKEYDLLLFYRASRFKGDDMVLKIINKYKSLLKIVVIAFNNDIYKKITKNDSIFIHIHPSDSTLGELFSKSWIVVHPSLSEGFGSIPQEAIQHDCYVISSKTGWLIDHENHEKVKVVKKHSFDSYACEIDNLIDFRNDN